MSTAKLVKKPVYNKDNQTSDSVFQQLKTRANEIVEKLEPSRRTEILFKAIIFPLGYFASWTLAITSRGQHVAMFFLDYFLMGIFIVLNYLNIIHDAVHHTIFKNRKLNDWYVYLFDVMGANSYIWKMRHIRFHHNYPNVDGWDTDIDQSPIVRVVPHSAFSRLHKYQHIYLPFIYPFFLFNWLLVRDFKDAFDKKRTLQKLATIPKAEYIKLFIFKISFLAYTLVLPKFILGVSWGVVLAAFCCMLFTASIFALIVLLPPHANSSAEFPEDNDNHQLPYGWFMHMLKTTNDISGKNRFTQFLLGNFNFHVAHHLFPNIHHIYYPEITEQLKILVAENKLPYRSYPIGTCLLKHYQLLKQNATDFNIWEEDM